MTAARSTTEPAWRQTALYERPVARRTPSEWVAVFMHATGSGVRHQPLRALPGDRAAADLEAAAALARLNGVDRAMCE